MPILDKRTCAGNLTRTPGHHFFGYYDKSPWDATGRYVLALESTFADRQPEPEDAATIGLVDTSQGGRWMPLARTTAWNWQQGTMLQWLPDAPGRLIIYNVRLGDRYAAIIRDVHTGHTSVGRATAMPGCGTRGRGRRRRNRTASTGWTSTGASAAWSCR